MVEKESRRPLRFLHIGDVHLTTAGQDNHHALQGIVAEANVHLAGKIDFAILPGDIAEDGTSEQFALAAEALAPLAMPWRAIPGDHDFKPRSLAAFYDSLKVRKLPYAETVAGVRCLYLDIVSAGSGGPDFRLNDDALVWLRRECNDMARSGQGNGQAGVVFMHAYPADYGAGGEAIAQILDHSAVVLVDTGHTHYNELCHDGRTIYAATRSVGQIEEGEVGYALACVDEGDVSWRFKPLGSSWPFVMITSPADRRLSLSEPPYAEGFSVRATVFGASPVSTVEIRVGDGAWKPMQAAGDGIFEFHIATRPMEDGLALSVRARAADGGEDVDTIELTSRIDLRQSFGGDKASIGAWPSRHLLGTQLGPNRNGRKW